MELVPEALLPNRTPDAFLRAGVGLAGRAVGKVSSYVERGRAYMGHEQAVINALGGAIEARRSNLEPEIRGLSFGGGPSEAEQTMLDKLQAADRNLGRLEATPYADETVVVTLLDEARTLTEQSKTEFSQEISPPLPRRGE